MIEIMKDGNMWMAYEDVSSYPESDAGSGDTPDEALQDLYIARPDLVDTPVDYGAADPAVFGNI